MDLKQKLKDLLNLSKEDYDFEASETSCSLNELGLTHTGMKLLSRDPESTIREFKVDPLADQEILETIEAAFVDEECDGSFYELKKLAVTLDLNVIQGERQKLATQLSAVTRKLFAVILQKQAECAGELGNVLDLQDKLDTALGICSSGRLQLNRAKEYLAMTSLGLLAHHERRRHLVEITQSLKAIRTLEQMGQQVQELLFQEDYAAAIQLLIEGQQAAETYKHFNCVAQLSSRLQDTLEIAEEQLDAGLAKICHSFDAKLYRKLCEAFTLLGKQCAALDQSHLHLASRLHSNAFHLVKNYVELSNSSDSEQKRRQLIDYNKLQFQDLCRHVTSNLFIPCLRDLCSCLWSVTFTYHKIHDWQRHQAASYNLMQDQNLDHGRIRLWNDVQIKTRTFLLSVDLNHFSIDEFLHVLNIVDRLMEVGFQFCGSGSEILLETVRQQSTSYFRNFHRGRLEELRIFLENESWENCPVKSSFTVLQLIEFRFLSELGGRSTHQKCNTYASCCQYYGDSTEATVESPFAQCGLDRNTDENILAPSRTVGLETEDSDDDIATATIPGPLLANTTLSVLRLFGRYIHLMRLLKTIAFDVLICLNQLFDFYLYSVYTFFGNLPHSPCTAVLTPKLREVLGRIEKRLILLSSSSQKIVYASAGTMDGDILANTSSLASLEDRVVCPSVSPLLRLEDPANMYGLKLRLVAAESVVFVARQMEILRPTLKAFSPPDRHSALEQFFVQTLAVAHDLRLPVYTSTACRCLNTDQIVLLMSRVQWDIRDVMSQHSYYVDVILQALTDFSNGIQRLCETKMLPPEVYNILWDQAIKLCYNTMLEGFATARKCSNEGRALMQLDFRHLQMKMEVLTRLRPLPDASLLESYIKAFYLPETALDHFVQQHTEYEPRHLVSLLQCVGQANKKTRLSLAALMEELDLSRR